MHFTLASKARALRLVLYMLNYSLNYVNNTTLDVDLTNTDLYATTRFDTGLPDSCIRTTELLQPGIASGFSVLDQPAADDIFVGKMLNPTSFVINLLWG